MSLTIRPVAPGDEAAWRRLWTGYLAFYNATVAPEVYRATFARLTGPGPGEYRGLVAERGGALVGLAHMLTHRHCWRVEDVVYLQDLFVAPEARGGGIGAALIRAVYAAADAAGTPHVYWLTQTDNATARALYDRVGQATPFMKYTR